VVYGVEDEFDAGGDAQLVEDAEQVFLNGVLAEVEFAGGVAVAEAFGDEGDDLFLARGEELVAAGVEHAEGWDYGDQVEEESHLFGVGPDLTAGDALDAAAEQAEMGVGNAENAAGAGAERAHNQVAVVGLDQKNFSDGGMGKMNAAHGRHLVGNVDGVIEREDNHFGGSGGNCLKDGSDIDRAGGDAELGAAAEGAGQKLGLHAVGVGNEDGDCDGSVG